MIPLVREDDRLVLTEAAVVERIRRRRTAPPLHPRLVNAPLVLDDAGRAALASIQAEYLAVAAGAGLPIALAAPTWRANRERLDEDPSMPRDLNRRAVRFVRQVAREHGGRVPRVPVGGLLGCRGDAYRPREALDADAARTFHAWQAEELASAEADFLLAATVPSVAEATGLARALAATGTPAYVSFVVGRDGRVLDGTPLDEAIDRVDEATADRPLAGFGVNCAHPSFLDLRPAACGRLARLTLIQANAAALDHADLDEAAELHAGDVDDWARSMLRIHRAAGVRVLGGCCGTDRRHLEAIVAGTVGTA